MAIVLVAATSGPAQAAKVSETLIYNFAGALDGSTPMAGVVADAQGRLYGTTSQGGVYGKGTVYQLLPPTAEVHHWTEQVLHSFGGAAGDGATPVAEVLLGPDGSIFGTTQNGGISNRGTVFKLSNSAGWPATTLHSFTTTGGAFPTASVVFGSDGLLYGTTAIYSDQVVGGQGVEFSVSPSGDKVEYQQIDAFGVPYNPQGSGPVGLQNLPSFYGNGFVGATNGYYSGSNADDSVYASEIGTQQRQTTVYRFGPSPDVTAPTRAPFVGSGAIMGSLYGCAGLGGPPNLNGGGIYQISRSATGRFSESVIYYFGTNPNDPDPFDGCSIVQGDGSGTIYGTSSASGYLGLSGSTFFSLTPPVTSGGAWSENVLLYFNSNLYEGTAVGKLLRVGSSYFVAFSNGGNGPYVGFVAKITVTP